MAKQALIEIKCDRCKRAEYVEHKPDDDKNASDLMLSFGDTTVEFPDLCVPCKKTIGSYVAQIAKPFKGKSPERKKTRAKKENPDGPSS